MWVLFERVVQSTSPALCLGLHVSSQFRKEEPDSKYEHLTITNRPPKRGKSNSSPVPYAYDHHLNVASSGTVTGANAWSRTTTLNQLASGGPSLAYWNNTLYMGWAGTDGNHSLNLASAAPNSLQFGSATIVNFNGVNYGSPDAPSLTTTANLNYAWREGGDSINIAYYNGTQSTMGPVPSITTDASPAVATFNDALCVGWLDGNANLQVEVVP